MPGMCVFCWYMCVHGDALLCRGIVLSAGATGAKSPGLVGPGCGALVLTSRCALPTVAVDTRLHVEWNEVKSLRALSPVGSTRTSLVHRLARHSSLDSQDSLEVGAGRVRGGGLQLPCISCCRGPRACACLGSWDEGVRQS